MKQADSRDVTNFFLSRVRWVHYRDVGESNEKLSFSESLSQIDLTEVRRNNSAMHKDKICLQTKQWLRK